MIWVLLPRCVAAVRIGSAHPRPFEARSGAPVEVIIVNQLIRVRAYPLAMVMVTLLVLSMIGSSTEAHAHPEMFPAPASFVPVAASFEGTVAVDGGSIPDGTVITAFVNSVSCGETTTRPDDQGIPSSYKIYVLPASARAGCGTEHVIITFAIGLLPADQAVEYYTSWEPQRLDLTFTTPPGITSAGQ
jgi:hypothetical protein